MGRSEVSPKHKGSQAPEGPDLDPPEDPGDVAFVYGKDEQGVHVLRRRSPEAPLEAGVIRPLTEGRPITEEVITLSPRPDAPNLFDVKTELEPSRPLAAGGGPSQVATDSYRKGWDSIWGRKRSGPRSVN